METKQRKPRKEKIKKTDCQYQFLFDKETIDEMRALREEGFNFQPLVRRFIKDLIQRHKESGLHLSI